MQRPDSKPGADEQLAFLALASETLASSLEYETTLEELAHLVVPTLADWCSIEIVEADRTLRNVVVAHADPAKVAWARELQERFPTDADATEGIPNVVRTGKAEFFPEIDDELLAVAAIDDEHLRLLREVGLTSAIIVPLTARERTFGALSLAMAESGRRYEPSDLTFAQDLARRSALAIDNARLFGQAQAALRDKEEAHALLDAIFTRSPTGTAFLDSELRFVRINEALAVMFDQSVEELVGRSLPDVDSELVAEVEPLLREALATGEPVANVEIVRRRGGEDGGELYWIASCYPIPTASGETLGVGATLVDVTHRRRGEETLRRLEDQLRQAQKMEAVGRLAGGIAHDFNNLLTVILGYSDLIGAMDLPEQAGSGVAQIRGAAEQASSLTRQLLVFSRRQMLQPRLLDLNDMVQELEPMLRRLIGEHIEFATRLEPELGATRVDPGQIAQVLMNLAVNARDAMPQGGNLTIETTNADLDKTFAATHAGVTPGRFVMLGVTDTGIGMDPETRDRIFEPFFTTKDEGEGTGLGLSTVYGIVKQSGGDVWVYSEPGRGTTFKIYLPIAENADEAGSPAPSDRDRLQSESETVLLVEDAEPVRDLVESILEAAGYRVLLADNGADALERFGNAMDHVDVLITDVVMPRMSGPDLVAAMRERQPGLRVLYTSGYTGETVARQGVLETAHFLQKPFTADQLQRTLREVLETD